MATINFINPLEMLRRIVDDRMIDRDKFVIIVTGRGGPTGKTWLCQELRKLGYHASELSPMSELVTIKDDGFNRMTIDDENRLVVIVLNEILPMYRNKGFGKTVDEDEDIYIFRTHREALKVYNQMRDIAEIYGVVTRADFMDCVNADVGKDDVKRGWTGDMLTRTKLRVNRNGYFFEFPRSVYLG